MQSAHAKQAIIAIATNELAKHEEFDRISVDAICEQAHVSRSSFYRLFQDKYAILEWCQIFPFERGIQEMGRTLTCLEGAQVTLQGFSLFNDLFFSTSNSTERKPRELAGFERGRSLVFDTLRNFHSIELNEELRFQAHWGIRILLGTAKILSGGDFDTTPTEAAALVTNAFPPRLRALLDAPPAPKPTPTLDLASILMGA